MSEPFYFVKEPRWRNPNLDWRGGSVSIPAHTHEALVAHIERGENPYDDFFDALLSNDLAGAVHNADHMNLLMIPHIIGWLYNYALADCQGSELKMLAWRERGGLAGKGDAKS